MPKPTDTVSRLPAPIKLIAAGLALLLGGCVTHEPAGGGVDEPAATTGIARVLEDIVYSPAGWPETLRGDLYLPRASGRRPVVLMVHGGSWSGRSRADMSDIAAKVSRHGYAVFNVSYRFAPAHTYPAQLHDLGQALRWLDDNANRYRLDTTRINAWGYSSGAHLAALIASYDATENLSRDAGRRLPGIRAVVAGGIPSDLRKYDDSPIVARFLGGPPEQIPAVYADASPAFHVSADDPPVFLYHGKLDFLVTPDQATDYYRALRDSGVDAELFLHGLRGHGTMFVFGGTAEDRAIAFLNRNNAPTLASGG